MSSKNKLHASGEDYLETILVMNRNQLCKVLSPKSSETEQIALFHCS